MTDEEKISELEIEVEILKSQFVYLCARLNLLERKLQELIVPVYDYDTLPKSANRSKAN